jgi:dihydrofolate reductase
MRKIILIVHTSLDGFVAGVNGELSSFAPGDDNLAFVNTITETADAALFGRISYFLLNDHWPGVKDLPNATKAEITYSNWYNNAQKIVLSKLLKADGLKNTTVLSTNVINEIIAIKEQPGKDILIFGSPSVAQLLMQHDLIDSYWIFINPAIFPQGIPLFAGITKKATLKLTKTKEFSNGEFALHYTVER